MMDIGAFIGQDLRHLAALNVPTHHLYAVDIVSHWDLGYHMFRDRDKFHAHFLKTDILHPSAGLQKLQGRMDIISITHVLHQWDLDTQLKALKEVVKLTRPDAE